MRRLAQVLGILLLASPAHALVWPDVPEQVEHGLAAQDPAARRIAAQQIRSLGISRGAPLALKAMSDPDVEVRLAAAQSAIDLHVTAATEEVLGWLGDREVRLRIAACAVARAMPSEKAVSPLARALGDGDAAVRGAAANALGALSSLDSKTSVDAVAPLLGRLDDPTPAVRIQVARSLARLGDTRAVVPLVGKVEDSVPDVREAVAQALGELGDRRASQALVLQLRDAVVDVKIGALEALGRLRTPDAVDAIAAFLTDRNPSLRQSALVALGRIASPDAVRALVGNLGFADDANGGVERTAVRDALVSSGPNAVAALAQLLDGNPPPQAASSAAWVLGEMGARAQAPRIIAAMRRGVLPPAAALHALAGAAVADSVPVVLEFVDDPSPIVRAEAARAAEILLDPSRPDGRAVEPLAAALRDPALQPSERAALTRLLGRTGAPRAGPILLSLLSAKDTALKIAAIDGLATLGPAGADDALIKQLTDTDPAVRLHAAMALADAGSAKARDVLLAKMDTSDEIDRGAVLVALRGILARAPSDAAVAKLSAALSLSVGPERDAILTTLGRANSASSFALLQSIARSPDTDDRRAAASALSGFANAAPTLLGLLADREPSVRAQAAWSCGFACDKSAIARLLPLASDRDSDVAANATAAIGKILTRTKSPADAASSLCPRLTDARALVRANALTGLAANGASCNGAERKILATDDNDVVRLAAANAVALQTSKEDLAALDRCARSDRSGPVANRCLAALRGDHPAVLSAHPVEVYVVPSAEHAPAARTNYALSFGDGFTRCGTADRRGAVYEAQAPSGTIELLYVP
ncbi:MAG: HEAT repeat domain-containing protein [Polyangiaceae bacterium]